MKFDGSGRYSILRGIGEDSFVELWDQSLAPAGLAFVVSAPEDGPVTVTGYDVAVPYDVFAHFLEEAKSYVGAYIAAMPPTD